MDIGQQPGAWHDFFIATATAAAALLGLFFVAISLHVHEIESHPVLRNRARTSLQALATLLATCLCVLLPGQSNQLLGAELIVLQAGYWIVATLGVIRMNAAAGGLPRRIWLRNVILNSPTPLQVAAGISLIARQGPGLFLEAPLLVTGLLAFIFTAWSTIYGSELREQRGSVRLR